MRSGPRNVSRFLRDKGRNRKLGRGKDQIAKKGSPAMIPCARSLLSRDKRLPLDTWNTSGLQENVFGNQFSTFGSTRDRPQGIHSCAPQREQGSVPQPTGTATLFTRNDKQNRDTIPMPTFAGRPSTMSSLILVDFPKNSMVWKIRFKSQVTTCSDFPSEARLWIKEVEMVDSLEGERFSKFRDAGREDCFCSEQDHPEFAV